MWIYVVDLKFNLNALSGQLSYFDCQCWVVNITSLVKLKYTQIMNATELFFYSQDFFPCLGEDVLFHICFFMSFIVIDVLETKAFAYCTHSNLLDFTL